MITAPRSQELTRAIATLQKRVDAPGFSAAVVLLRGSEIIFSEARGLADKETGRRNTLETPFHTASVGKMLTAVAAAHVANANGLDLRTAKIAE